MSDAVKKPGANAGQRGKPFEKGNTLSRGRPAGSRNVRTIQMMEALAPHAGPLLVKAIDLALAGDVQCLMRLLDRLLPPGCRSTPIVFDMGEGTHADKAARVLDGMSRGVLAAEDSKALLDALQAHAQLAAVPEILERLKELEDRLQGAQR